MIKLGFCDMPRNFDVENNFLTDILEKNNVEYIITSKPDFLIYSCYGSSHYEFQDCVKIFWTVEPIVPDFNICDYAVGFEQLEFGERYCKRPYWLDEKMPNRNLINDNDALNRKFCNFIYSNEDNGIGTILRKEFALKLMNYKHVDCPGKVLNNMQGAITPREGDWRNGKLEFIKNYKFTIAFENSMYLGYTTEKLMEPYQVNSIPIYWGNPDVLKDFNEKSMILCNGKNFDEVIEKIKQLDQDDDLYLQMLHEQPMNASFVDDEREKLEKFFLNIFEKGNAPFNKDPLGYIEKMAKKEPTIMKKIQRYIGGFFGV